MRKTAWCALTLFGLLFFGQGALGAECAALPEGAIPDDKSTDWEFKQSKKLDSIGADPYGEVRFYRHWQTGMYFAVYSFFGKKVLKTWSCENTNPTTGISANHWLAVENPSGWKILGEPIRIAGTAPHQKVRSVTLILGNTKVEITPR